MTVVLRDDAPEWALIDITQELEIEFGDDTTYGRYVEEIKSHESDSQ